MLFDEGRHVRRNQLSHLEGLGNLEDLTNEMVRQRGVDLRLARPASSTPFAVSAVVHDELYLVFNLQEPEMPTAP